jgi:excinuclease ABC subunit C
VTFLGGLPLKKDYRRFKVRSVAGKPNDVKAMSEVITRRYAGSLAKKLDLPDLVMVDGGLAQVNAAERALEAAQIDRPAVGLAKREEELYFPGRSKPLRLPREGAALRLLQRIRDEAHRFAVTFHRARRRKTLFR